VILLFCRFGQATFHFECRSVSHISNMRTHPYAEATYRVVPLSGGAFGVQITIPDSYPTTVSSFATEVVAEDWITCNRQRLASEGLSGRWFKKPAYIPTSGRSTFPAPSSRERPTVRIPCTLQSGFWLVRIVDWSGRAGLPGVARESCVLGTWRGPAPRQVGRDGSPVGLLPRFFSLDHWWEVLSLQQRVIQTR
jgi:hypothetical protein